jgi:hypothetical protein
MHVKTLFLAWEDKPRTRGWYPVGRMDVQRRVPYYRFCYMRGAERAQRESGFEPLLDFPDLHKCYDSFDLFPLFQNRVIAPGRRDFRDYLSQLDLPDQAGPLEILSVDGGRRVTDSFEVFPKMERRPDGSFRCRFFLHGWRHLSEAAQRRMEALKAGEHLYVAIELTNPVTGFALQIQTQDYHMIGWAPRYLVSDLVSALATAPGDYRAQVVQVNPIPAPSKQRLLVEFSGHWPLDYEPMTKGDFEPLVS